MNKANVIRLAEAGRYQSLPIALSVENIGSVCLTPTCLQFTIKLLKKVRLNNS